jgi:hypothetical protein
MTAVDPSAPLVEGKGHIPLIDVFEGRTQLFVSYHMSRLDRPVRRCSRCRTG